MTEKGECSAGFNIDIFSVLFLMAGGRWSGNPRNGKWRFFTVYETYK